jgi:hypothetical protein
MLGGSFRGSLQFPFQRKRQKRSQAPGMNFFPLAPSPPTRSGVQSRGQLATHQRDKLQVTTFVDIFGGPLIDPPPPQIYKKPKKQCV